MQALTPQLQQKKNKGTYQEATNFPTFLFEFILSCRPSVEFFPPVSPPLFPSFLFLRHIVSEYDIWESCRASLECGHCSAHHLSRPFCLWPRRSCCLQGKMWRGARPNSYNPSRLEGESVQRRGEEDDEKEEDCRTEVGLPKCFRTRSESKLQSSLQLNEIKQIK